jgi:hypothetical protein
VWVRHALAVHTSERRSRSALIDLRYRCRAWRGLGNLEALRADAAACERHGDQLRLLRPGRSGNHRSILTWQITRAGIDPRFLLTNHKNLVGPGAFAVKAERQRSQGCRALGVFLDLPAILRLHFNKLCSPFIMLPRAEADCLFRLMSSTNGEPSPPQNGPPIGEPSPAQNSSPTRELSPAQNGSPTIDLAALLKKIDWKKDKKRILLIAGGAMLAVVIAVLIPAGGGANANGYSESQMKSSPVQALASMAAKMRPDLEIASVDAARQTVTLKDKNGALSTFRFDPRNKTLVPVPAVQPKPAESQPPPPPADQAASTPLGGTSDWIPIYPATTPEIVSSVVTPEGDKETIATFKSGDKPTEIVQFYQTKLQESGFKIEVASSGEQGGMIQAQDGERKRMLILNVSPGETGTMSRVVTVQRK